MPETAKPVRAIPYFDLTRQYALLRKELEPALLKQTASGKYILGDPVAEFEKTFAAYCGALYAVGVGSGTDALTIALHALGIGKGDEVIVPSFTYSATVFAILHNQATPVFCDVDPETYVMDPDLANERITKKTRALLPVHLYGQCADMTRLRALAKKYRLHLIEDSAQAHGAAWKDQMSGTFSDAGCFSFYPTKNLGAFGDGGMILTSSKAFFEKCSNLRNLGHQSPAEDHQILGWTSRLDNLQACILSVKLRHLGDFNLKRRKNAAHYKSLLAKTPLILPQEDRNARHVYHLFVVQVPDKKREALCHWLAGRGIPTLIHYPKPVHQQPFYRRLFPKKWHLPVTERLSGQILSLPLFPELTPDEINAISEAVIDFYR